jgi:FlaA1/EpsC-like NDP-sugar epimerase
VAKNLRRFAYALLHPRLAVVLHDLSMTALAWYLAKLVRLSLGDSGHITLLNFQELVVVLAVQGSVLWWTGLYRGLWRFASLPDLWNIGRAVVVGSAMIGVALFLYDRLANVPRSVLVVFPVLLFVFLGIPRLLYRGWKDRWAGLDENRDRKRVLVLGAGRAGELLVRDLKRLGPYRPVGFLDDNRKLRGARVHDVPVLGTLEDISALAREVAAEMLLIAMPSIPGAQMRRVVELCELTHLPFRMVPRLQDVIAGRSSFNALKEVAIEDLLGRDPIQLDWTAIRQQVSGRRILVTGGGGSIGAELVRQAARLGAASIAVLDLSEFNLYRIEREIRGEFPDLELYAFLGDVCDAATCQHVLSRSRPQLAFHAAAFKHVPMLQGQVREAFRNNVLGTQTLAQAAIEADLECMVMISTDKAVNPANVMGATKRIAEQVCQSAATRGRTRFITVRFGNVLDSAGSVVPLFREQIRAGGPVTVTHPEINRYFMTIPEACQLIYQAAVLGQGGEIFALDMGEPVPIRYLAEQMIRLAGKEPDRDIQIVYTGLREGEKLFEELFHEHEAYTSTAHSKIFLAQHRAAQNDRLPAMLKRARKAITTYDEVELLHIVGDLVPEFSDRSAKVLSFERAASA